MMGAMPPRVSNYHFPLSNFHFPISNAEIGPRGIYRLGGRPIMHPWHLQAGWPTDNACSLRGIYRPADHA